MTLGTAWPFSVWLRKGCDKPDFTATSRNVSPASFRAVRTAAPDCGRYRLLVVVHVPKIAVLW